MVSFKRNARIVVQAKRNNIPDSQLVEIESQVNLLKESIILSFVTGESTFEETKQAINDLHFKFMNVK